MGNKFGKKKEEETKAASSPPSDLDIAICCGALIVIFGLLAESGKWSKGGKSKEKKE